MLKSIFKTNISDSTNAIIPARVAEVDDASLEHCQPLPWTHCFDGSTDLSVDGGSFRLYTAGDLDALRARGGTAVVLMHGAGQSSLVWAHLVSHLKGQGVVAVAYDGRGHGSSKHDDEKDLSKERLSADCATLCNELFLKHGCKVVLVGHSMGGAIAVHASKLMGREAIVAMVVMDVVEGTALASLSHIFGMVNSRPTSFVSTNQAVRWALDSNILKSTESARMSIPSQLRLEPEGSYSWRTDLIQTRDFWSGWYTDLSSLFLSVPIPKLLILAGTDRLDTQLTVGQMQGKYQLEIIPHCGHQLQEDEPELVANKLSLFLRRVLK